MATPDPILSPHKAAKHQVLRILALLDLLSPIIAVVAAILVSRGDARRHIHMIIAAALGCFLTMLLGSGLMALLFISSSSGHDEAAASFRQEKENK